MKKLNNNNLNYLLYRRKTRGIFLLILLSILFTIKIGLPYYTSYKDLTDLKTSLGQEDSNLIGLIEIPKINEKILIYKGLTNTNLDKGAVLFDKEFDNDKTSTINKATLNPKGNNYQILAAHSGTNYSNRDLFLNVPKLEVGDIWTIFTKDHQYSYEVEKEVVVPQEDLGKTLFPQGKIPNPLNPMQILVTCVDGSGEVYHVNTHRNLTYGKLVDTREINSTPYYKEVSFSKLAWYKLLDPYDYILVVLILLEMFLVYLDTTKIIRLKRKGVNTFEKN